MTASPIDAAGFALVLTTSNSAELTRTIAMTLLEQRLAACVQATDIRSFYRWDGTLHDEAEQLLVIKCRASAFEQVAQAISAAHPYDVPEIVQIPVTAASADYLGWLEAETHVDG